MKIIGITGPIGSGKTYVASAMSKYIPAYINTDTVYHTLISESSECTDKIRNYFGDSVIAANGGVDRKILAEIVFSDKKKLKKLNEIAHACVEKRTKEIMSELEKRGEKAVLVEVPIMFESGFDKICDAVICVSVGDDGERITRIMKRSGLSEYEAKKRIDNQGSSKFYEENSDYIIYNNGEEDLNAQIESILAKIFI